MKKFMEVSSQFDESQIVIVGFPMDITVARPGTYQAPESIRKTSLLLEYYSHTLKKELKNLAICDIGDIKGLEYEEIDVQLKMIKEQIVSLKGKRIVALGGEHTISLPIIEALIADYPQLRVIQIDAHTDLRDSYENEIFCHATVMRRIIDVLSKDRVFQLGIRSGEKEEFEFNETGIFSDVCLCPEVLNELIQYPIYLTIDMDILDPAYAPGVGIPEPAGITTHKLLEAIYSLKPLNIIGVDLVEVSPIYDASEVTAITAAKIIREAILNFWD